jgi:hypothetical protein
MLPGLCGGLHSDSMVCLGADRRIVVVVVARRMGLWYEPGTAPRNKCTRPPGAAALERVWGFGPWLDRIEIKNAGALKFNSAVRCAWIPVRCLMACLTMSLEASLYDEQTSRRPPGWPAAPAR